MSGFNAHAILGELCMSKIFTTPGFHIGFVKPDYMHVCCLGILQYLLGNVMWELFLTVGGVYSRPKEACATLLNMTKLFAKRLGLEPPFNALTIRMIKPQASKRPRMALKAAEGRYFLPVLTKMLADAFPPDSALAQVRLDCCKALCRCYYELRNWMALEPPARLEKAGRQHLLLYKELHNNAGADSRYWHMYPKHHLFIHVCDVQVNPAALWNYSDEDEIGRAARLARRCHEGSIQRALIERYRVQFDFATD